MHAEYIAEIFADVGLSRLSIIIMINIRRGTQMNTKPTTGVHGAYRKQLMAFIEARIKLILKMQRVRGYRG